MFRLINSSQGLRPTLISKIKLAKNSTIPPSSSITPNPSIEFFRNNATITNTHTTNSNNNILNDRTTNDEYKERFQNYTHKYHKPSHINRWNKSNDKEYKELNKLSNLLQDENFKNQLNEMNLYKYSANLYSATITSRRLRLGNSRNRDKDQEDAFNEDLTYQTAIINLTEMIAAGDFNKILSTRILFKVFGTLLQFKLYNEILNLWETGVSQSEEQDKNTGVGQLYLSHDVLSIVLQVAYETKRFSYEEIKSIYNMSVNENEPIHPFLSDRIGQVAISEGDHARGLDALEALMNSYETNPEERSVLGGLAQLHLSFIGNCKDTTIAKRFLEKAIDKSDGLPYVVVLKAPYMASFLQNCYDAGDSMEEIIDYWSRISQHYHDNMDDLSSKAATINTSLFKIFFTKYSEPNEDSLKFLKLIFTKCPNIDEVFLNTLISNMIWKDKSLVQDVIDAFEKFKVNKSLISYRVILKQAGNVNYSIEEILKLWNDLLNKLDQENYKYIANADWSSLRAATVFSENFKSKERESLYYSILKTYKNYMQHDKACINFLRGWIKDAKIYKQISKLTTEDNPKFENEIEIEIPNFENLKENVNYSKITKRITDANPRLIE
ncbi:RMD9 [Candida pseudojiufengensis]|uniref:RMD9 n=1 Tax=Candida pseudojiufengensis TaxID=497109 RepID=UPI00222532EA|nr:RMD9 [Candida pseudojiufengensis]KAI5961640.1 RMD9 [Candida pseudojiufengensis]